MSFHDTDNKQLSMLEKLPLDVSKVILGLLEQTDLFSLRQCSKKLLNTTNEYLLSNPLKQRKAVTQLYRHRQNTTNITQAALERHSATKENGTLLLSGLTAEERLQRILIGAKKGHLNDCDARFVELCSYEEDLKLITTEVSLVYLKHNDPTLFNEYAKKIYPIFVAINNQRTHIYLDEELRYVRSILQIFFDNNIATPFSYVQSLINKIGSGSEMYDSSKNIIQFTINQISAEQKKILAQSAFTKISAMLELSVVAESDVPVELFLMPQLVEYFTNEHIQQLANQLEKNDEISWIMVDAPALIHTIVEQNSPCSDKSLLDTMSDEELIRWVVNIKDNSELWHRLFIPKVPRIHSRLVEMFHNSITEDGNAKYPNSTFINEKNRCSQVVLSNIIPDVSQHLEQYLPKQNEPIESINTIIFYKHVCHLLPIDTCQKIQTKILQYFTSKSHHYYLTLVKDISNDDYYMLEKLECSITESFFRAVDSYPKLINSLLLSIKEWCVERPTCRVRLINLLIEVVKDHPPEDCKPISKIIAILLQQPTLAQPGTTVVFSTIEFLTRLIKKYYPSEKDTLNAVRVHLGDITQSYINIVYYICFLCLIYEIDSEENFDDFVPESDLDTIKDFFNNPPNLTFEDKVLLADYLTQQPAICRSLNQKFYNMYLNELDGYRVWGERFLRLIFMTPYEIPCGYAHNIAVKLLHKNLHCYSHSEVIEYFDILINSMTRHEHHAFFKSVLMHMNANPTVTEIHSKILALLLPHIDRADSNGIVTEYINRQQAYQSPIHGIPLRPYNLTHPSIITLLSTTQLESLLQYCSTEISQNPCSVTEILGKIAILRPEIKNSVVQIITDYEITDANRESIAIFKTISCTLATLNINTDNEHLSAFINRLKELINDPNENNNITVFTKQFIAISTLFNLRQYHDIRSLKNCALSIFFKFFIPEDGPLQPKNWELHFNLLYSVIEYLTDDEQVKIAEVLIRTINFHHRRACKLLLALPLFSNDMLIQQLYRISFYFNFTDLNISGFLRLKHGPVRGWHVTIKYRNIYQIERYVDFLNILSLTFNANTPEYMNNTDTCSLSTDLTVPDIISQLGQNKSKNLDTTTERMSSLRLD